MANVEFASYPIITQSILLQKHISCTETLHKKQPQVTTKCYFNITHNPNILYAKYSEYPIEYITALFIISYLNNEHVPLSVENVKDPSSFVLTHALKYSGQLMLLDVLPS